MYENKESSFDEQKSTSKEEKKEEKKNGKTGLGNKTGKELAKPKGELGEREVPKANRDMPQV